MDRFQGRGFGLLLLLALLPAFIPVPIGAGGPSGAVICLIGLQFLARMDKPWLPGFLARRRVRRRWITGFRDRMGRWLDRLEKITRPRVHPILSHPVAHAFKGVLLVTLGVLLALPLPLTNYPFAGVLLVFAFALIERDGLLMILAWLLGLVEIGLMAGFSGSIAAGIGKLFS